MVQLNASFVVGILALVAPVLSATVRITALGDSLTAGPGCWRAIIWRGLQKEGITNTDFVGSQSSGGCWPVFDGEHEGHGGFRATGIVSDNQLPGWLAASKPDIVQVTLGTNDVWSQLPTDTIIEAFSVLVDQMRANKPTMRILIAQIPPMNPSGCSGCTIPAQVVAFNAALAAWAPGKSTAASPITIVDCYTGFVYPADFDDGVHPSPSGTEKLAQCWYGALKAAILAVGGTSATTTRVQTNSPTTSKTSPTTLKTTTRKTTTTIRVSTTRSTTKSPGTISTRVPTTTTFPVPTTTLPETSSPTPSRLAPYWSQCGGRDFFGPSVCERGTCQVANEWFSQCL